MASSLFRIVEHQIPAQHIREYPRALINSQEDVLHLAVKQYIPLDNPNPQPGDVTIIGAHANGFPKELYEPLWEDILVRAKKHGFAIRSIWIADIAHQGASGVLNEELIGNDPSWMDHPRDLLHMINLKRDQMPRPIVGIAHSMGGNNLVNVAYLHPRLFTTLILIDPAILNQSSSPAGGGPTVAQLSTFRRDIWPSRDAAAQSFKKSKFYRAWDARVLERWIKYGLRDMPTAVYPDNDNDGSRTGSNSSSNGAAAEKKVTLTTTKHQEVFTFLRPNYAGYGPRTGPALDRSTHADLDARVNETVAAKFYRPEPPATFARLPTLRPSVLWVFGGASDMSTPELNAPRLTTTGTGIGGSGGQAAGRVKAIVFDGIGHLIAMEAPQRTADEVATWLGDELRRWREDEDAFRREWAATPVQAKRTIDDKWIAAMGGRLPGKEKTLPPKL